MPRNVNARRLTFSTDTPEAIRNVRSRSLRSAPRKLRDGSSDLRYMMEAVKTIRDNIRTTRWWC